MTLGWREVSVFSQNIPVITLLTLTLTAHTSGKLVITVTPTLHEHENMPSVNQYMVKCILHTDPHSVC